MDTYYYDEATMQALLTGTIIVSVISLAISIIIIIAMWKIFAKAGLEGWKSIIPLYNSYCLYKITWGTGWMFLTCLIPLVGGIIAIITLHRLSKSFGRSVGFTIGLIFLSPIFLPILGFGSDEYQALPSI